MTKSVLYPSDAPVTLDLLVNGKSVSAAHELLDVRTEHEVNRIPLAQVTIADNGPEQFQFAALASGEFEQGNQIEVKLGRNDENVTVFKGVILSRKIQAGEPSRSSLVLRCTDETIRTKGHQTSTLFRDVPDSDVIKSLLGAAGLASEVESTPTAHSHQLTGEVNDWDFILSRAGANGQVVIVRDGKVSVKTPSVGEASLALEFGTSIVRMDLEEHPLEMTDCQRPASPPASVRGTVAVPGHAAIGVGGAVELAGFGAPFDGSCYVRGVRHLVAEGLWTTEVDLGLPEPSSDGGHSAVPTPRAAGPRATMGELQIAEVIRTRAGPRGRGLIEVRLPRLAHDAGGVWVKSASPYATENAGIEFMPEAGDTVIVAFVGGDLEAGVILGSLHTSSSPPPLEPDWPNSIKSIVSRSQLKIAFDDEHEILVIETPGGHRVTLSDDEKLVAVADSSGNSMELRATGMAFTSPGDIAISAGGTVSIEARSGIRISTAADAEIGGANVSITAQVGLTAKGMASAELSASGQTTVKGAMVMIN